MTIDTAVVKDGATVKQKKIVFPFCCINFSRTEEMANFETEFTKGVEEMKKAATA